MKKTHQAPYTGTYTVLDAMVCDICKKEYPPGWHESRGNPYSFETEVSCVKIFDSWDDHDQSGWSFDICPECMESVVRPFVESFGEMATER